MDLAVHKHLDLSIHSGDRKRAVATLLGGGDRKVNKKGHGSCHHGAFI